MDTIQYRGTGRRKKSIAQVRLLPGNGKFTVNGKDIEEYFDYETLRTVAKEPLELTDTEASFDVIVKVVGGGYSGQAGAVRHGVARALLEVDPEYRSVLKKAGFLKKISTILKKIIIYYFYKSLGNRALLFCLT